MGKLRNKKAGYGRLLEQERLILDATEAVVTVMAHEGVSRQELAGRLGKTKSFVSQLLCGERNMTLRTLADLGSALGYRFTVHPRRSSASLDSNPAVVFGDVRATVEPPAQQLASSYEMKQSMQEARGASDSHEYALAA